MKTARKNILNFAAIISPPARLKCSEWADKHAYLPDEGNAEPGKYRLSRMPHQASMLDDPFEPGVSKVFHMLASQAGGKTACQVFRTCYVVHQLKQSIIVVRDTKDRAMDWMRQKFLPTVEAMPVMKDLLEEPRKAKSKSTSLKRKFPGGTLSVIGAKAPGALRGTSAGHIDKDEIDSYQVTKEGDPIPLIDRAAKTFSNGSNCSECTPTIKGFSRIESGFELGDQQYYFVPCPVCGAFQVLKDEQMKFSFTAEEHARFDAPDFNPNNYTWEIGDLSVRDTRKAIYVCEHCHHGWSDHDRIRAYMSGHVDNPPVAVNGKELRADWKATAPFKGIRSRHLSGMYMTIGLKPGFENYLHMFSEDYLTAKRGGRETFMVWVNTFRCRGFEDAAEKVDWKTLKDRAEDFGPDLPAQVCWIAGGADVHPDRVEINWWGWGAEQEAWNLHYHVIYGDFDLPLMQDRVWDYLANKRFKHPVLGELAFNAIAFDSGKQTKVQAVYKFCAKHQLSNVWAVKGFDQALGAVYQRTKERRFGGLRFNLNVDYLKNLIFERVRNTEPGPRYIHFPKDEITVVEGDQKRVIKTPFSEKYFQGFCSEKRMVVKNKQGGFHTQWVKMSSATRNEPLDTSVYAFGVYEICKQDEWIARKWKEIQAKLRESNKPDPVANREVYQTPEERKMPEAVERTTERRKPMPRRRVRVASPFSGWKA